jgi:hypothetical protein
MKYKEIYKKAVLIDNFIDANRKTFTLPMKEIDAIIKYLFPSCYVKNKGWFKTVYRICTKNGSRNKTLVLKIAKKDSIENDHNVYKMVPRNVRRKYFAKIFWHTKHCLLQEYGNEVDVTPRYLNKLSQIAMKYGVTDIKKENIRRIDDRLKIVDASVFVKKGSKKINFIKEYVRVNLS